MNWFGFDEKRWEYNSLLNELLIVEQEVNKRMEPVRALSEQEAESYRSILNKIAEEKEAEEKNDSGKGKKKKKK